MVRYLNRDQKAAILVMLRKDEPPKIIASHVGCSLRTCQRLKRLYNVTGDPFPPTKSRFNALVLEPRALEKLLAHLQTHPDLQLDEMQRFLVQECDTYVSESTIRRRLKEAGWTRSTPVRQRHKGGRGTPPTATSSPAGKLPELSPAGRKPEAIGAVDGGSVWM